MKIYQKKKRNFYLEKEDHNMTYNKNRPFKLNYFNRFVFTINIIVLALAYSIYLNKIFSPSEIPYFNFVSIGYPIIFVFVLLFLVYWILVSWKHFVILFFLSLGTLLPLYLSYPLINIYKTNNIAKNLTVMTFNPHAFRGDGTEELVNNNLADIILFQEGSKSTHKPLKGYYSEYYSVLSIYSKYPIIESNRITTDTKENSGLAAYADIDLGFDTIRVINIYMEPMYISKDLVKDVINSDSTEEIELTSKKIENKLILGMKLHELQLKEIIPFIQKSPYPVIVGSDLNSTPGSYEYEQLSKYLYDSYIDKGKGNATTFHGFKFPIRIDYLFHSKEFEVIKSKVIRKKFSDHFPVVVDYHLHK